MIFVFKSDDNSRSPNGERAARQKYKRINENNSPCTKYFSMWVYSIENAGVSSK